MFIYVPWTMSHNQCWVTLLLKVTHHENSLRLLQLKSNMQLYCIIYRHVTNMLEYSRVTVKPLCDWLCMSVILCVKLYMYC